MGKAAAIFLFTLLVAGAWAQEPRQSAAGSVLAVYPESSEGLRAQITELLEAAKAGDGERLGLLLNRLLLPSPAEWFREVFGETAGAVTAGDHIHSQQNMIAGFRQFFTALSSEGFSKVEARRFDQGCKGNPSAEEYRVLSRRQQPIPMYTVIVWRRGKSRGQSLWFFAYVGGAFRYVGKLDPLKRGPAVPGASEPQGDPGAPSDTSHRLPPQIRVEEKDQQTKLIEQVTPAYPYAAQGLGIQGTVQVQAIIGTDGRVRTVEVLSGECLLAEAVTAAVRKWRYQPTLVNGQPVEVVTTIAAIYRLSR